jgi:hypothetical protein
MGDETNPKSSASGGCSMGCASLFVLAGLLWPLLHLLGGTPEPEVMFIPVMIGGPAFLVGHVLAYFALRSKSPDTVAWGRRAIRFMWGSIATVVLLAFIAWIVDLVTGKI